MEEQSQQHQSALLTFKLHDKRIKRSRHVSRCSFCLFCSVCARRVSLLQAAGQSLVSAPG